jgi:hypothetical protein
MKMQGEATIQRDENAIEARRTGGHAMPAAHAQTHPLETGRGRLTTETSARVPVTPVFTRPMQNARARRNALPQNPNPVHHLKRRGTAT